MQSKKGLVAFVACLVEHTTTVPLSSAQAAACNTKSSHNTSITSNCIVPWLATGLAENYVAKHDGGRQLGIVKIALHCREVTNFWVQHILIDMMRTACVPPYPPLCTIKHWNVSWIISHGLVEGWLERKLYAGCSNRGPSFNSTCAKLTHQGHFDLIYTQFKRTRAKKIDWVCSHPVSCGWQPLKAA